MDIVWIRAMGVADIIFFLFYASFHFKVISWEVPLCISNNDKKLITWLIKLMLKCEPMLALIKHNRHSYINIMCYKIQTLIEHRFATVHISFATFTKKTINNRPGFTDKLKIHLLEYNLALL